jgi:phospholipase/carboxylesterase
MTTRVRLEAETGPMAMAVLIGLIVGCGPGCSGPGAVTTPHHGRVVASTAVFEPVGGPGRLPDAWPLPVPDAPDDGLTDPEPPISIREGEAAGLYYLETTVGAVDPDAPVPLMVVLHGLGDRPHVLEAPYYGTPDPVRVVQPRAPHDFGEGYAWVPLRVSAGKTQALAEGAARAADRLARFIAEVRRDRPSRGRPVVTGFSQGGILTFVLAVRHPKAVGAAFPVSGWLPPPLWPEEDPGEADGSASWPPIWAMHGLADRIVPVGPTRSAIRRLRELGGKVLLREIPGAGHERTEEMEVLLHDWLSRAVRTEWRRPSAWGLAAPSPPFGPPAPGGMEHASPRGVPGEAR